MSDLASTICDTLFIILLVGILLYIGYRYLDDSSVPPTPTIQTQVDMPHELDNGYINSPRRARLWLW